MKRKILAGNWKMNKTPSQTEEFLSQLIPMVQDATNGVIVAVPYTSLDIAVKMTKGTCIKVAAQNCHYNESGAYTGEISPAMLADMGVDYVIIGHSERRQYYNETNEDVCKKIKSALAHQLKPIVCIGETLAERNANQTEKVLFTQISKGFEGVESLSDIIVAYEPVWAIGTGVTATAEQAQDTISFIRSVFCQLYCDKCATEMCIQYGGSMNEKNAKELLSMKDIDGGLIGGASLVAEKFNAIIRAI